jgi:hypothetical protein
LLSLVQTDSEIARSSAWAFILRRVELIANGISDVVVLGSAHCAGTLRIKEFLEPQRSSLHLIDLDREESVQHSWIASM